MLRAPLRVPATRRYQRRNALFALSVVAAFGAAATGGFATIASPAAQATEPEMWRRILVEGYAPELEREADEVGLARRG